MRRIVPHLIVISIVLVSCTTVFAGEAQEGTGDWWYVPYPEPFDASQSAMVP